MCWIYKDNLFTLLSKFQRPSDPTLSAKVPTQRNATHRSRRPRSPRIALRLDGGPPSVRSAVDGHDPCPCRSLASPPSPRLASCRNRFGGALSLALPATGRRVGDRQRGSAAGREHPVDVCQRRGGGGGGGWEEHGRASALVGRGSAERAIRCVWGAHGRGDGTRCLERHGTAGAGWAMKSACGTHPSRSSRRQLRVSRRHRQTHRRRPGVKQQLCVHWMRRAG